MTDRKELRGLMEELITVVDVRTGVPKFPARATEIIREVSAYAKTTQFYAEHVKDAEAFWGEGAKPEEIYTTMLHKIVQAPTLIHMDFSIIGHLPATFMVVAPGSWTDQVWDDINRMRTLNTTQSQRRKQLHVCPLQLDIVDRLINRYSNPGDLVLDPFGGIGTVALEAMKAGRRGYTIELNSDYFRDAVGYLKEYERTEDNISLFDLMEGA